MIRPRRLRRTERIRDLVAEVGIHSEDLIQGHFVIPGSGERAEPIPAMPGIERQTIDRLVRQVETDYEFGIRQVLLFGTTEAAKKNATGRAAYEQTPLISEATQALKRIFRKDLLVITDVCLCPYTDHGHCGVPKEGIVDNDATLPLLERIAVEHAAAGADVVAPSDMMDGRIHAIRLALDSQGFKETAILSYAAKFASGYYGPFREAMGSRPMSGDRKGYQADMRSGRIAVRDALLDEAEGADILMVKPALAYLDIIACLREKTSLPLFCFNVSGEYSMVMLAAREGFCDLRTVVLENFTAMRRAGADRIITYHAREALREGWL